MKTTDDLQINLRVYGKDKHKLNEILIIKQDQETGEVLLGIRNNYSPGGFLELARISVLNYGVLGMQYFDVELQAVNDIELG
jgi:hypothetical protein